MGTGAKIGIVVLVVAGLAAGGYFYWKSKEDEGYGSEGYSGGLGDLGTEPAGGGILGQQVVESDSVPITATPPPLLTQTELADKIATAKAKGKVDVLSGLTPEQILAQNKAKLGLSFDGMGGYYGINGNDPARY